MQFQSIELGAGAGEAESAPKTGANAGGMVLVLICLTILGGIGYILYESSSGGSFGLMQPVAHIESATAQITPALSRVLSTSVDATTIHPEPVAMPAPMVISAEGPIGANISIQAAVVKPVAAEFVSAPKAPAVRTTIAGTSETAKPAKAVAVARTPSTAKTRSMPGAKQQAVAVAGTRLAGPVAAKRPEMKKGPVQAVASAKIDSSKASTTTKPGKVAPAAAPAVASGAQPAAREKTQKKRTPQPMYTLAVMGF